MKKMDRPTVDMRKILLSAHKFFMQFVWLLFRIDFLYRGKSPKRVAIQDEITYDPTKGDIFRRRPSHATSPRKGARKTTFSPKKPTGASYHQEMQGMRRGEIKFNTYLGATLP